jgi:hypothetical protein
MLPILGAIVNTIVNRTYFNELKNLHLEDKISVWAPNNEENGYRHDMELPIILGLFKNLQAQFTWEPQTQSV